MAGEIRFISMGISTAAQRDTGMAHGWEDMLLTHSGNHLPTYAPSRKKTWTP